MILPGLSTVSCAQVRNPRIEFVIPIWDSAPHNAFTDLCRFKNYWYCVFREGVSHHSGDGFGRIRVIRSTDTSNWQTVDLISDPEYDLRDPKLTVTPRGRLMMSYLAVRSTDSSGKQDTNLLFKSRVTFSKNGLKWSQPKLMNLENEAAWRVTWIKGNAYTVGYNYRTGCTLYRSGNGVRYKEICRFSLAGFPNEATLLPLSANKIIVMIRREEQPRALYLGRSDYPYTKWDFTEVPTFAAGPNLITLPDSSILACHRSYFSGKGRLWLSYVTNETVTEKLMLPSTGDCGYAGMYWFNDALWVSYYSSQSGKAKIYLAKVVFDSPIPVRSVGD